MPEPDPEGEFDPNGPMDDGNPLGTPEAEITLAVDVSPYLEHKRRALTAHASQVTDIGMMLSMPPAAFDAFFGTEWFIEPGADAPLHGGWLLDRRGSGLMATIRLVRHGRATGGWDADVDPGLDERRRGPGRRPRRTCSDRSPTPAPPRLVTSPMRRCRETAAPLAARWGVDARRRAARHRDPVAGGVRVRPPRAVAAHRR